MKARDLSALLKDVLRWFSNVNWNNPDFWHLLTDWWLFIHQWWDSINGSILLYSSIISNRWTWRDVYLSKKSWNLSLEGDGEGDDFIVVLNRYLMLSRISFWSESVPCTNRMCVGLFPSLVIRQLYTAWQWEKIMSRQRPPLTEFDRLSNSVLAIYHRTACICQIKSFVGVFIEPLNKR